ncbi:hypothetical protein G6F32_013112 [Rhizopus arrhizus]|nr:hypothetical protein G6F32_013112 [Rhizopus arrhizus]
MEHQTPGRRAGFYAFRRAFKAHADRFQFAHDLDQLRQRPAEPVKPPHHQRITLAGEGEGVSQSRPFSLCAAGRVGEDLFTTGRRQGVPLEIHFLIVGRYPRISDFHCVVRQVVRTPIL